jgi:hypothetical protein
VDEERVMLEISVVMATFQGAPFLKEQLESLSAQTLLPVELIVSDDGSTDRTLEIVESFAATAPFVVHVSRNTARLGYRENFMRAATMAAAPLIAFCDQDDVWDVEKLRHMAGAFENDSVLLAYHNASVVDDARAFIRPLYGPAGAAARGESKTTSPWAFSLGFTQVFRRELLRFQEMHSRSIDSLSMGEKLAHDQWYFFLASTFGSVQFVNEPLALYRQHGQNVFGANSKREGMRHFVSETKKWSLTQIRMREADAAARSSIVLSCREILPVARHEDLERQSRHYAAIANFNRRRADIYGGLAPVRGLRWLSLLLRVRLRRDQGLRYDLRYALRDLAFGVLLGLRSGDASPPSR